MTDRLTVDSINSDQLDELYDDLDRYEEVQGDMNEQAVRLTRQAETAKAEAARWLAFIERGLDTHMAFSVIKSDGSTEQLPCADWCHACRVERAEAAVARVRALHQPTGVVAAAEHGQPPDCAVCGPNRWPCPTYQATEPTSPATTEPKEQQ